MLASEFINEDIPFDSVEILSTNGALLLLIRYCYAPVPPVITAIFNSSNITVHVPAESLNAYKEDFNWKSYNIVGDL